MAYITTASMSRYAPYVEKKHKAFLNSVILHSRGTEAVKTAGDLYLERYPDVAEHWYFKNYPRLHYLYYGKAQGRVWEEPSATAASGNAAIENSPFANYTNIEVDDAFFGVGNTLSGLPALYDMYGEYMSGLDIDALYAEIYEKTVNAPVVNDLINTEAANITADINNHAMPIVNKGKNDINSIMVETFLTGNSVIVDMKDKLIAKFDAQLRYSLSSVARVRWATQLSWNAGLVSHYTEIIKLYYSAKIDSAEADYGVAASNSLWPFTVLDFERVALGALQRATSRVSSESVAGGASRGSTMLAGALSGAATGAQIGNMVKPATAATKTTEAKAGGAGWGAAIGVVTGVATSYINSQ